MPCATPRESALVGAAGDSESRTMALAVDANMVALTEFEGRFPPNELLDEPELLRIVSGVRDASRNTVLKTRFSSGDVDRKIENVLGYFRSRGLPMTWIVGPTTQPESLGSSLLAHGLTHSRDEIGMTVELRNLGRNSGPPGLAIERVRDDGTFGDFARVHATVFDLPLSEAYSIFQSVRAEGFNDASPRRLYVGYVGGVPVTASMMFLAKETSGIYAVATLPTMRRRGLGTAMTLRPLLEAKALGCRTGILAASPMALSLYRHLRFHECCSVSF